MGYASRNNIMSQEVKLGKIKSINSIMQAEMIRMNPKKAYNMGLITFEQLKFIRSNPSKMEVTLNEMLTK